MKIAPSILSADFSRLGELVREVEAAGADRIHVDVMDGHFVPNLSMGAVVVRGLRPITRLPLEVHLMVEHPGRFLDGFARAGADTVFPGFGGQNYIPESTDRVRELRRLVDRDNLACEIEVDGGITTRTIPLAAAAGATVFVAGTAIFGAKEGPVAAVKELKRLAEGAIGGA